MIDPQWTPELVIGLAEYLPTLSTAGFPIVFDVEGYTADEERIAVYLSKIPAGAIRGLSVRFYMEEPPQPGVDLVHTSIQLRCRLGTDPLEGQRFMGLLYSDLHEKSSLALGRARASLIMGGGLAYLNQDENDRHEYSQNYRIRGSGHLTAE